MYTIGAARPLMAGMTRYLPYEPRQQQLLPNALQDWLPEEHLAYYISDVIDSLDLGAFHARYEGGGARNQPFDPAMMVKVLVYGYATGVFSSRKIARKLHEDVAFRVLAAGNFPAHRTICDFRALHLKELSALFDTAHIVVAAELTNHGSDAGRLAPMLEAVHRTVGDHPQHVLTDAGFRSEVVFEHLKDHPTELIVALGREGKQQVAIDPQRRPHTTAMAKKFQQADTQ
jgi:transposase